MPDVNVTYDDMENAATRMTSAHDEITTQLTALLAMVDGLVESGFKTDVASGSFHDAYTEFNTGVKQTIEGLDVMSKYLVAVADKFREADASGTININ
jgi:WXG100 family type VII secretion target